MPNKEFLEEYSLFRKLKADMPRTLDQFPKVPINMECHRCSSIQTFKMTNDYHENHMIIHANSRNEKVRLLYLCQSCKRFERQFQIFISPELDYCYKFGQYPE